jgi:REP-associated tyrosine transposase
MSPKIIFPRRPPRLILSTGEPLYFVTFCTYHRRTSLATLAVHSAFLVFCKRAYAEHDISVGRYVIMPDHVHLFVRGAEDFHLGRWIGALKQCLGKSMPSTNSHGRIWQEGSFDHVLRSDDSYGQKWEYVRQNPVRAGLVAVPEDWPFQGEIIVIDRA